MQQRHHQDVVFISLRPADEIWKHMLNWHTRKPNMVNIFNEVGWARSALVRLFTSVMMTICFARGTSPTSVPRSIETFLLPCPTTRGAFVVDALDTN